MPSLEEIVEGEAPASESAEYVGGRVEELPIPSDSMGKVKAVWGGVLSFIQQTLALYAKMPDLTDEERRDLEYKWRQRQAIDTSESQERELRLKTLDGYNEERDKAEAFRLEQIEHMRRCETIERERTDRIVATIRDGFQDVISAMKFDPQPNAKPDRESSKAF